MHTHMQGLTAVQLRPSLQAVSRLYFPVTSCSRLKPTAARLKLSRHRCLPEKDSVKETAPTDLQASDTADQESAISPPRWQVPWGAGFRYELNSEALGLGVSGGVTALLLIVLATAAAGGSSGQNTGVVRTLLEGNQTGTIVAIAAASLIGAPALEELVYRGFLLPSLTKWMHTPAAVLLQALIFAGSHLSPGDIVPLTALGLSLGVVTVAAEGNLVAPTIAHALYNAVILYNVVK